MWRHCSPRVKTKSWTLDTPHSLLPDKFWAPWSANAALACSDTVELQLQCALTFRRARAIHPFASACLSPRMRLTGWHWLRVFRVYHLPRFEVLLWFYHALCLWKHIGVFHSSKKIILALPPATKVLELRWGVKNKVLTLLSFWGLKDAAWKEDYKFALRIEIGYFLFFWKKRSKTDKIGYFPVFSSFLSKKWGQMLLAFNSKTRFGILSSRRIF